MTRIDLLRNPDGSTGLSESQLGFIKRLLGDWQVLADLSFGDLVLWLPTADGRFIAQAHRRPSNVPTIHVDDVRGRYAPAVRAQSLREAMEAKRIVSSPERLSGVFTVNQVAIPVVYQGESIAVLTRETSTTSGFIMTSSNSWYPQVAEVLCEMLSRGEFPYPEAAHSSTSGWPRVADGALFIDEEGVVQQITPNAKSCFLRLGVQEDLRGRVLAEVLTKVLAGASSVDESLPVVLMGRASWTTEVEVGFSSVIIRSLPLRNGQQKLGALLLCRDLTEERQRQLALLTKDATIREIHHRVKNNLQTVSALLRLQARRSDSTEVREALNAAERRVWTIARVHEALSQNVDEVVDFDPVAKHVLKMAAGLASPQEGTVTTEVSGSFGMVDADAASALSVVLAELVSNAVEHGLHGRRGQVEVEAERSGSHLLVRVLDRGQGIDPNREMSGLGTQIVQTMVRSELGGTIEWLPREGGGTQVVLNCIVQSEDENTSHN